MAETFLGGEGGPAFPRPHSCGHDGECHTSSAGMSYLEWLVGQALTGTPQVDAAGAYLPPEKVAARAVAVARATLAAVMS